MNPVYVSVASGAVLQELEPSPSKAGVLQSTTCSPLKRKALFDGAPVKTARTAADACRKHSYCTSESSGERQGGLGNNASESESEGGGQESSDDELQLQSQADWDGNPSDLTSCHEMPLPQLALARELPESIRGELEPTPMQEMVSRDHQLAEAIANDSLPDDTFMLRCDKATPWVKRLRHFGRGLAPLVEVAAPPLGRAFARKGGSKPVVPGLMEDKRAMPVFDEVTVPELELKRDDPEEERLRQEVMQLMWEPDMLHPSAWTGVDRWHNISTEYYAARQKLTWNCARHMEQASTAPENFVSTLLC